MNVSEYQIGKENVTTAREQGAFDSALAALTKAGYTQTTTQQLAQARMAEKEVTGKYSTLSQYGSWTQEGFVYVPQDLDNILVVAGKHNPILKNPTEATNVHRNGNEFYVEADKLRQLATPDGKRGVLLLPRSNTKYISIDAYAEHPLPQFLLGKDAQAYGKFLKEYGIREVQAWTASRSYTQEQKKPFARLLWLRNLDDGSDFLGVIRLLDVGFDHVRGVRPSAEGVSLNALDSALR